MRPTAIQRFETDLVREFAATLGRRPVSNDIADHLNGRIGAAGRRHRPDRSRAHLIRLAIKARPDDPGVDGLLREHANAFQEWAARTLRGTSQTVAACNGLGLPVPVIFSCRKYLDTARRLQRDLQPRYFGVEPVIVSGDPRAMEERLCGSILHLPVDDSYEGLPLKVFETITLFNALGAQHGIIKIDDDVHFISDAPLDPAALRLVFATGDYIGAPLDGRDPASTTADMDRTWHFGKCRSEVAALYTKPFVRVFATGGLYYLSRRAISLLAANFIRFPGSLSGEVLEDKAVGDALARLGVPLTGCSLRPALGISTEGPERAVFAYGPRSPRRLASIGKRLRETATVTRETARLFWLRRRRGPGASTWHVADRLRLLALGIATTRAPKPVPAAGAEGDAAHRARGLLARVMRAAESLDTALFLFWETLLGHVRPGRFHIADPHVDVALFEPAKLEPLQFALMRDGLRFDEQRIGGEFRVRVFDPHDPAVPGSRWSDPFLDIYVYALEDTDAPALWAVKTMPRALIMPGRATLFEGVACREPQWPIALLDRHCPPPRQTD